MANHECLKRPEARISRAYWFRLAIVAGCLALGTSALAAPPKLDSLFPAGGARGQTIAMNASGTFGNWPVKVWVDRPGVEITAHSDKGKLSGKVAQDAAPGVYWIRLYDDEGASALRPFIVGTLPEIIEAEPNDDLRKLQVLDPTSVVVNGRLEKNGDVDTFAVSLRKGETLVASLEANRTIGSAVDASLQVVSGDGFVLQQNDDYHDLDPQIVFTAQEDGKFLVRTFGFPATPDSGIRYSGNVEFIYRLTITTGPFVEHPWPLVLTRPVGDTLHAVRPTVELVGWNLSVTAKQVPVQDGQMTGASDSTAIAFLPGAAGAVEVPFAPHDVAIEQEPNERGQAQDISLPCSITGRIAPARDSDCFRFQAAKGDALVFRVESRSLGFPLDPLLRIADATGQTIAEIDDSGGGRDSELTLSVPADGEYRITVRDLHGHGGDRYVYRLTAARATPDFSLKLATDTFTLTPGKPLEIPVTIERTNGFAGEIEVRATGLPDGAVALPVKSLGQGDSAKSVKLAITSPGGPSSGPIRVIGLSGDKPEARPATAPVAGRTTSTSALWLTVLKAP